MIHTYIKAHDDTYKLWHRHLPSLPLQQLYREGPMARRLTPGDVLCTHLVRNDVFTDGRRLEDTVQELQRDPHKILPKMKFVEFEGVIWSRSSRRLQCYQKAGATVLIEGVHFRMHAPDPHFFDGLNSALFFAS